MDHLDGRGSQAELITHQDGIESLIDDLSQRNMVDRSRVGLMGQSRSGFYVDHMITFSEYEFAAALAVDASLLNLAYYTQLFGLSAPGMVHFEKMIGIDDPSNVSIENFRCNSTTFHLDRVRTPLRLERYLDRKNYSGGYWDHYAMLKRLGKPVELVLYPLADHATINPTARLESAGGAVDWFDFWLNGRRDSAVSKTPQYDRWRTLRDQQASSLASANTARAMGRRHCKERH